MNNDVSVGDDNKGSVCGGDMIVNDFLPCKNGDGMLSIEDYQRLSYCNNCIRNSRRHTRYKYHNISIIVSIILVFIFVGSCLKIYGRLPTYMSFMLDKSDIFYDLMSQVLSTAFTVAMIVVPITFLFKTLAARYNHKHYPLHK